MFVYRTRGVVAATLAVMGLGLGACDDPSQNTDLRPEGPPDVLAVLVFTDAVNGVFETATYCKPNDEKRPGLVGVGPLFVTEQICPENLSENAAPVDNAYPDGWYIRIMFDELLDPDIEALTPVIDEDTGEETGAFTASIAGTHPVKLECKNLAGAFVEIDYDGYYSPSGNRITWPLGPSLVIKPSDPELISTNSECQVTINDNVVDKSGVAVEATQRGPFKFTVAPIKVIAIDPPDDPEFDDPIDALQIYFDNPYIQFNTNVDLDSLCVDEDADGLCDDEKVFSITDVAHPSEGPGYCDVTFDPCGTAADCELLDATNNLCGRGFCGATGDACNKPTDCPTADDHCGTLYAYDYLQFGLSATEYGIGPPEPIETEHKYTMQFTQGAKLKDRCGRETTLGAPNVDDLTLVHFATNKFAPKTTPTSIVSGETASANKRLQFNFTNVLEGHDTASTTAPKPAVAVPPASVTAGAFTLSPMPQKLIGTCLTGFGGGCTLIDLLPTELLIIPSDGSGQLQLTGHLKINTEYTATLKAGTVIKDFYLKEYTVPEDKVVKWKTAAAIQMTGMTMRFTGQLFGIGNNGTVTKPTPTTTSDIRLAWNASMDPTTLDVTDIKVESLEGGAVPTLTTTSPTTGATLASGCGITSNATNHLGTCTLRLRGLFAPGTYKITLVKGAVFKDIYGTEYTQAADQSITVTIAEAPAATPCL
jgi:hypothetical protein